MPNVMGPTPLIATHVLKLEYTVGGFTHSMSPFVKAQPGTGPTGYDLISTLGGGLDTQGVIDDFKSLFGPIMPAGSAAAGWTLYEYVGTVLNPIAVGSWTFTAGAGTSFSAIQFTMVGVDSDLYPVKFQIMEASGLGCSHWPNSTAIPAGAVKSFVQDWETKNSGNWSSFFRNRNDKMVNSTRGITVSYNRNLRRKRGLV